MTGNRARAAELWAQVEEIAAEVEARLADSPDPLERCIEHRLQVAKLHRLFWRIFR